jgi:spore maturation protein CgeB
MNFPVGRNNSCMPGIVRFLMKILCVFGKYDYGDPERGEGYEYRNFIPGFESLGHEVIHFDSWNRDRYANFSQLNQALLDCIQIQSPDILFCVPLLYEIWLETLAIIEKHTRVKTILWCTDDSWKYREVTRHIGKAYDLVVTTYPHILPCYRRDGISRVMLSQWAADNATLMPPKPACQCRYPVVFVGAAHGDRKDKIRQLEKKGVAVQTFGYGWKSGPVPGELIPRIINNARIALNFSNSRRGEQLKARTFEVPGAGGFLMTEAVDGVNKYFQPGREIEVVLSIQEMADKIQYYLQHPDARDFIAKKGFERTENEHLYLHRFEKILESLSFMSEKNYRQYSGPLRNLLDGAVEKHQAGKGLSLIKQIVVRITAMIAGKERSGKLARRLFYEIGWRCFGKRIYGAAGWPGRLFYRES